jgi:hypothetical protein
VPVFKTTFDCVEAIDPLLVCNTRLIPGVQKGWQGQPVFPNPNRSFTGQHRAKLDIILVWLNESATHTHVHT